MTKNIELLKFIQENCEMGLTSLTQLLEKIDNQELKTFIKNQHDEYKNIFDKCKTIIESCGKEVKTASQIKKIESYLMINMKTMMDKSPNNIAEMLMQGNLMGIIEITKRLKQYKNQVDEDVYFLGEKLLSLEEKNLEESKKFLGNTL